MKRQTLEALLRELIELGAAIGDEAEFLRRAGELDTIQLEALIADWVELKLALRKERQT